MLLSEELFGDDREEMEQFQNFMDITKKMNTTTVTKEKEFYQMMIDSVYGRFMELLQVNMEMGGEWMMIQFYEETNVS